jgi:hypothetical protein
VLLYGALTIAAWLFFKVRSIRVHRLELELDAGGSTP